MSGGTEVIGLDNIIAFGAAVAAGGALIFSALTYRRNRKSEQNRTAREQMNRVITRRQTFIERILNPTGNQPGDAEAEFRIAGEVLEECEYFGYMIYKKEITDVDILMFY